MKFNVGDKIIAKKNAPYAITTNGWKGVVVGTRENPNGYIITSGSDIRVRKIKGAASYSVNSRYFDLDTANQKIVITSDGKTTLARLIEDNSVIKTATAKCNPSDEFNFETGAKLAFERLLDDNEYFDKDKIYVFDLKKYQQNMSITERNTPEWAYEAAGNQVEIINEHFGRACGYGVFPEWCRVDTEDKTIKVGDLVRIIDGGLICPTYHKFVEDYIDDKRLISMWSYGKNPYYIDKVGIKPDIVFVVVAIKEGRAFIKNARGDIEECYVIMLDGIAKEALK